MKNVRQSAFETNSSSTHSIVIANKGDIRADALFVDENGVIEIPYNEFGWEIETYYDAPTKASYCAIYALNAARGQSEDYPEHTPNQTPQEMFEKVLKEVTGAKEIKYDLQPSWGDYPHTLGYIDHQSYDVAEEAFESEESLKQFIFNPKSVLVTDNDNH